MAKSLHFFLRRYTQNDFTKVELSMGPSVFASTFPNQIARTAPRRMSQTGELFAAVLLEIHPVYAADIQDYVALQKHKYGGRIGRCL